MGKLVRWLIGTGIAVGVPAGGYYGLIHDVNEKNIEYNENYTMDNLTEDLFANCLDYTKEEGKIAIGATDQQVNDAIYNASKDSATTSVIPQMYCEFNKGRYDFTIQIKSEGMFLPVGTKIKISTTLEEKIRSDFDNKSCFVFTFKDVKIGRLGGVQKVAIPLLKNFITEAQIQEAIGDSIHATIHLDAGEIIYPKEELSKDFKSMMSGTSETGGIPMMGLFQAFFENDLVHLNTTQENALRFDIDCTQFAENSEYVEAYDLKLNDETKHGGLTLDKINEYVKKVLDSNEAIEMAKEDLFQFFYLGYDACPSTVKNELDKLDFASVEPGFDCKNHKGFELEGESLNTAASNQVSALKTQGMEYFADAEGFNLINFTEADINSFLSTTDVMGFNYLLAKETKVENALSTWKTSYICIDNFYCNIYDEMTNFVVGLNLNGYETTMIVPTTLNTEKSVANFATGKFNLTYEMSNIKFGNIELDSATTGDIFTIMASASGDAMKFSKDGDKYFITFDFSSAISSAVDSSLSTILNASDFHFVTSGADKDANGILSIKGKYNGII